MLKRTLVLLGALICVAPPAVTADDRFPMPASLRPAVEFWTRVYTEVGTDGGLLHDSREMGVVYEVIKIPKGTSRRARERLTDKRKDYYKKILRKLASGSRSGLSHDEQRVLALWPRGVSSQTLKEATQRLRFQLGQANKFRDGLIRSGAYKTHIEDELRALGVPVKLAALPHVESSYTPHAYSHVGAAGLWQFTRSTGRRFMRVDHVVDERLDPFAATRAAARLLDQNYQTTGTWPLAITSYNHGAAGMRRAKRQVGTSDIGVIVEKYRSRTFGFASRNFYAEFLAASKIDRNYEAYFGSLHKDAPIDFASAKVPSYVPASAVQRALGVDRSELKKHNPALLGPVWTGSKRVPKGFVIRIPRDQLARPIDTALASIPDTRRYARQTRDRTHRVRRGETLSQIAARYGTTIRELSELNGLRNRNRIRAGQKLRLPGEDGLPATSTVIAQQEPPADGVYVVRRGDTLSKIGRQFGVSPNELAALNQLRDRHQLAVGQRLVVLADAAPGPIVVAKVDSQPVVEARAIERPETPASPSRVHPPAPAPEPEPVIEPAPADDPLVIAAVTPNIVRSDDDMGPAAGNDPVDPEAPVELIADPSDYDVHSNDEIEVQATETLGHYAEWLGVRASRLRELNGLRYGTPIGVGETLKLDFARVSREDFERKRVAYHRDLQETFFEQFEISGTRTYKTRRGDSLWSLSLREFKIPVWLLIQYNPDVDFGALSAGTKLEVPEIQRHGVGTGGQSTNAPDTGLRARR